MAKTKKNESDLLDQEKRELNSIIGKGYEFEVQDTEMRIEKRFFGLVKKYIPVTVTKRFHIEEPTLGTLDRLSAEWIEIAIDEKTLKGSDGIKVAKALVKKHAERCARIIAMAVLGPEYLIPKSTAGGTVRYIENSKRLNELTCLFARTVQPSQLYRIAVMLNAISNFGDFLNSIRLMQSERTTAPNLIE